RDRKMKRKVRLFIIDDSDIDHMIADLRDPDILANYWKDTGTDVASYWVGAKDLREHGLPIVDDCALYDGKLLIQYEEKRRVMSFSVGKDTSIEHASKLFSPIRKNTDQA